MIQPAINKFINLSMDLLKFNKNYLNEVGKLYMDVFNSDPWNEKWTITSSMKRVEYFSPSINKYGLGYLIKDKGKGKVIGFIGGVFYYYDQFTIFTIEEMFINNNLQNKGIGNQLLIEFEKILTKMKVNKIELKTLKKSYVEKFYKNRGYITNKNNRIYLAKDIKMAVVA